MEWLVNLFTGSGVAHSVFIVAIVIAIGLGLNRIKFGSVSLGVTWILFVGIIAGHFGFLLDHTTAHFVKEFGLILFIYSIGLEVGPGFFSSFRKGGVTLNMLAAGIVLLGVCTAYAIHLITGTSLIDMVGVLSGAVTNTPGMGAAQQTFYDMTGESNTSIAQGYAVAYPLGVVGIILSIIVFKLIFRVNFENERLIMMERAEFIKRIGHINALIITAPYRRQNNNLFIGIFSLDKIKITRDARVLFLYGYVS